MLVVGDAMLDRYWFGAVDRISPEAPVPVVRVNREEERLGGAANVALNVKTLGAQATLLTVVGDDEPARKLRKLLEQQGVATLLGQDPQLYTIVKLRVIGRSQQLHPHRLREPARPRGAGRHAEPTTNARWPSTTRCCSPTTARAA